MEITKHFTASTTIVHDKRVLLHFHKKLQLWLPVGGHIDRDELPQDAAIREAKEESGLDIELFNNQEKLQMNSALQLINPMYVLLEDINPGHQHIDFIYYATVKNPSLDEKMMKENDLKWLTIEEIENMEMLDNVKILALDAIKRLSA